jgi:hypothetical protein
LCPDKVREVILARGHVNILATHKTTLEITKDARLSKRGNCVIAVSADKALSDLDMGLKQSLRREGARLTVTIEAAGIAEKLRAEGSSRLPLTHSADMVLRKSGHICNRTLAVHADKAAIDLSRNLVERLRDPSQQVRIELTVTV